MINQLPRLKALPQSLPLEKAVRIELQEGLPIFRASSLVQNRVEELLYKQRESKITAKEDQELSLYEELDDYLSYANRIMRNDFIER